MAGPINGLSPRGAAFVQARGCDGEQRGHVNRATLMQRVWGWDVLTCPRCEGRMKFIAVIKDREVIVRILAHVALVRSASLDCAREALGRHELTGELADG